MKQAAKIIAQKFAAKTTVQQKITQIKTNSFETQKLIKDELTKMHEYASDQVTFKTEAINEILRTIGSDPIYNGLAITITIFTAVLQIGTLISPVNSEIKISSGNEDPEKLSNEVIRKIIKEGVVNVKGHQNIIVTQPDGSAELWTINEGKEPEKVIFVETETDSSEEKKILKETETTKNLKIKAEEVVEQQKKIKNQKRLRKRAAMAAHILLAGAAIALFGIGPARGPKS